MEFTIIDVAIYGGAAVAVGVALHLLALFEIREKLRTTVEESKSLIHRYERSNKRREALARMRDVWGSKDSPEKECHKLLHENMWVLEPEFVSPSNCPPFSNKALRTIFRTLDIKVPDKPANRWHLLKDFEKDLLDREPDICGFMNKQTGLGLPYLNEGQQVFLIVELKKAGKRVTKIEFDQAHNYASLFRRLPSPSVTWNIPIECLVIGHEIDDDITDASMRWTSDTRTSITIRPMRYRDLLARAERLCEVFMEVEGGEAKVT